MHNESTFPLGYQAFSASDMLHSQAFTHGYALLRNI
jgi:hypothetical protein